MEAGGSYVPSGKGGSVTIAKDGTTTFEGESNGNITDSGVKGTVQIGNDKNVSGFVYGVYDKDGKPILDGDGNPVKITTGANGKGQVDLALGEYTVKEETVPSGYKPTGVSINVNVNSDGTVDYGGSDGTLTIEKIVGTISIKHKDTGTGKGIEGTIFGVYDKTGNPVIGEDGNPIKIVTGSDGTGSVKLEPGDYDIKPDKGPDGYELGDNPISVKVKEDGTVEYESDPEISSDKIAEVTIKKYEKDTTTGLEGVEIAIYNNDGNAVLDSDGNPIKIITDKNGEAKVKLKSGTYKFKEVKEPTGYILDDTIYKFVVENDGTVTFVDNEDGVNSNGIIYNERVYGQVIIYKYLDGTTVGLEGAEIAIYNSKGEPVLDNEGNPFIVTTNANGQVKFRITPGTYQFKEVKAPAGHILNDTMYKFTVSDKGVVTFIENEAGINSNGIIYNQRKEGYGLVTIKKYETGTTKGLRGAKIGIYDKDGNEVLDSEGNHIILTTNAEGQAQISLEPDTYQFKELEAPNGYRKDDTMYKFIVAKDGSVTFVENVSGVNSNGIIYNERVYGEVVIYKYLNGTKIGLRGAVIGIYDDDDGSPILDSEGKPFTVTTNSEGLVRFRITPGTYQFKEITAPSGYVLNDTIYKFTVSNEGVVTFIENENGVNSNGIIYNERIEGYGVVLIKKYQTGTTIGVSDAIIGIYDKDGNAIFDGEGNPLRLTTNANGEVQTTLEPGTYQFRELEAPRGYIRNDTMYKFIVADDGNVTFVENADGLNSNGIIYNEKIKVYGNVVIIKREKGTAIGLPGAVIAIYDEDGNPVINSEGEEARFTTDTNGRVEFQITSGTYQFKEVVAPDGYILNDTMYKFRVLENGTVTFIENAEGINSNGIIYNQLLEGYKEILLRKYKKGTSIGLAGAVIGIYDSDGKAILDNENNPIKVITDAKGEARLVLGPGTYQYKEEKAPNGYELNDTVYKFTVSDDGVITFVDDTDGIIYNEKAKVYGRVLIRKYEKGTTIGLAGAVIGIYDNDGNLLVGSDGNPIKMTTDLNGEVEIELEPGTYQFKEEVAPDGFVLDNTMYKVVVTEDGTVTFIENADGINSNGIIYNERIYGYILLRKYETGTTKGLAGAVIGIYDDEGNPVLDGEGNSFTVTTNTNGETRFALTPGTYQYKEVRAPEGYKLNSTVYTFVVRKDGNVTFVGNTEGIIYDDKLKPDVDPGDNNTVDPDDNSVVDNNTIDSGNNSISPSNNVTKPNINKTNSGNTSKSSMINSSSNIKQGKLPFSGVRKPIIVIIIIVALGGIYYCIKLCKKSE